MELVALLSVFGLSVSFIGIGYYLDFKRNKKSFISDLKGPSKAIAMTLLVLVVFSLFGWMKKNIFPIDKDYGLIKNNSRIKLGIPIIEKNWVKKKRWGNQFSQWYAASINDSLFNHKLKNIEFNLWGAISEEDYFESTNKSTILVTRYDYQSNKFSYYKIESQSFEAQKIVNKNGDINLDHTMEQKVELTKKEFDKTFEELKQ